MDDSPGIHVRLRRCLSVAESSPLPPTTRTLTRHASSRDLFGSPDGQEEWTKPPGPRESSERGEDPRQNRECVVRGPPLFAEFISRALSLAAAPEAKMRDLPRTMGRHVEVDEQPANSQCLNHHDREASTGSSSAHAHRNFVCICEFSNAPNLACV